MKTVSIFEGKNKFSQVVTDAANGEPQLITKNGKETAVVISYTEYKRLTDKPEKKQSLSEFLLSSPMRGIGDELDLTRDKDMGRPTIDFEGPEFTGEDE